jgi:hypothetical protein
MAKYEVYNCGAKREKWGVVSIDLEQSGKYIAARLG